MILTDSFIQVKESSAVKFELEVVVSAKEKFIKETQENAIKSIIIILSPIFLLKSPIVLPMFFLFLNLTYFFHIMLFSPELYLT
jgi:hypothetical protein